MATKKINKNVIEFAGKFGGNAEKINIYWQEAWDTTPPSTLGEILVASGKLAPELVEVASFKFAAGMTGMLEELGIFVTTIPEDKIAGIEAQMAANAAPLEAIKTAIEAGVLPQEVYDAAYEKANSGLMKELKSLREGGEDNADKINTFFGDTKILKTKKASSTPSTGRTGSWRGLENAKRIWVVSHGHTKSGKIALVMHNSELPSEVREKYGLAKVQGAHEFVGFRVPKTAFIPSEEMLDPEWRETSWKSFDSAAVDQTFVIDVEPTRGEVTGSGFQNAVLKAINKLEGNTTSKAEVNAWPSGVYTLQNNPLV